MWSKALWFKNYKEVKFYCWAFVLVSLLVPFQVYSRESSLAFIVEEGRQLPDQLYSIGFFSVAGFFQMLVLLLLAVKLVGRERNNDHYEFALSLPVKRQDIFLSKWLLGLLVIFVGVALSVLLAIFYLHGTEYLKEYISSSFFLIQWPSVCLLLMSFYSFAIMIGYLTGNAMAQFTLTGITSVLPYGMLVLIHGFLDMHSLYDTIRFSSSIYEYAALASLPLNMLSLEQTYTVYGRVIGVSEDHIKYVLIALVYLLATFLVTFWCSRNSKAEYNGKILLYKPLVVVLRIGVFVCFFLLGGTIIGESMMGSTKISLVAYYIGGLIVAGIASLILNSLLQTRTVFGRKS